MKLDQLKNIIREEVRSAVKEELQEVITEAVRIASRPEQTLYEGALGTPTTDVARPIKEISKTYNSKDPIMQMLEQTKANMTSDEYRNIANVQGVQKPNFASSMANQMGIVGNTGPQPGLDISQFDFVKKAGDIYKASVEKDKQKQGII